jgi:hypothetical protein
MTLDNYYPTSCIHGEIMKNIRTRAPVTTVSSVAGILAGMLAYREVAWGRCGRNADPDRTPFVQCSSAKSIAH